ncbi:MAG: hypothetical protein RLP12_13845 [Ekhidna sp.]
MDEQKINSISMIEVQIDDIEKISVESDKEGILLNKKRFNGEVVKINENSYKVFKSNKIFRVDVVDRDGKKMKLKVNGQLLDVSVTDHIDQILDQLGMAFPALIFENSAIV